MKTIIDEILEKPHIDEVKYTPKDFKPDVDVRWCAGCGGFAVLSPLQRIMPELGTFHTRKGPGRSHWFENRKARS
jgi:hypothetical protein